MLASRLLSANKRLQQCASSNPSHVVEGDKGPHVKLIQLAMLILGDKDINDGEVSGQLYGKTTAAAVLAYKQKRKIINRAYQTQADPIVGVMTIQAIDTELLARERMNAAKATDPRGQVDVRTDRE
jgi:hypothetical protein